MADEQLDRCERLMNERNHYLLLTEERRRMIHLELADEVPGLVQTAKELWNTKRVCEARISKLGGALREIMRQLKDPSLVRTAKFALEENNEGDFPTG